MPTLPAPSFLPPAPPTSQHQQPQPPTLSTLTFPHLLSHLPHLKKHTLQKIPPKYANKLLRASSNPLTIQALKYIIHYLNANVTYIDIPFSIIHINTMWVKEKRITHLCTDESIANGTAGEEENEYHCTSQRKRRRNGHEIKMERKSMQQFDKHIEKLQKALTDLIYLKMTHVRSIAKVAEFKCLQYIELEDAKTTSAEIRNVLKALSHSLRGLSLIRCKSLSREEADNPEESDPHIIEDAALISSDHEYPALVYLNISFSNPDESWLKLIRMHWMPSLEVIRFENNLGCDFDRLFEEDEFAFYNEVQSIAVSSSASLQRIVRCCPSLNLLDLSACELTDANVSDILKLLHSTSVRYLRVHNDGKQQKWNKLVVQSRIDIGAELSKPSSRFDEAYNIHRYSRPDIAWAGDGA